MSDQVSGDTGRTPLADVLGAAIQLAESRWERGEPDGVVLSLFVARELARALAPEPSGVPPEDIERIVREALRDVLMIPDALDTDGKTVIDQFVARVVARLSATPRK